MLTSSKQSKHLVNVFKEAKSAYRERKAEIVAGRKYYLEQKRVHQLKAHGPNDDRSSSRSSKTSKQKHTSSRPDSENQSHGRSARSPTSPVYPESHCRMERDLHDRPMPPGELIRRHTTRDADFTPPPSPRRTMSSPSHIDMDLAYGDIPPPLPVARPDEEAEFRGLVGKVKMLLDEADCVQYSVTAIIASLQKNPDAMAAVALTLAEISNIATKMAPGVLNAMKGSAPAVFALLASPQFLIAAGVGVGVTIVALGGYKIIKKIKAKNSEEDASMDEMLEFHGDVDRIDNWRRGIAEVEEQSIGTSVDGEFITPTAAALSRLDLQDGASKGSRRKHKSSKTATESKTTSSKKSGTPKSSKPVRSTKEKKVKKPSPLRLMFS